MGAFGEAFAAFAQPLIDQTDGSPEQLQKALTLSQWCYNTALLPAGEREEMYVKLQSSLEIDDDEFDELRRSVLDPMISRHEEMFPMLHQRWQVPSSAGGRSSWFEPAGLAPEPRPSASEPRAAPAKKSTLDRYSPCPCGSGKKHKFCCGAKRH